MSDPFHLQRFVDAQNNGYADVLAELRAGRKRTHWMWFVFPQIAGLGTSPMAVHYAISDIDEAIAYLAHPLLGVRLVECTEAVLNVDGRSLNAIFGTPDDMKFRSSMTLFAQVPGASGVFTEALNKYCGGVPDPQTLTRL